MYQNLMHNRNQTVHVQFMKNGQVVHEGVTFAGYIGLPTAWKKNHFAMAVNARFYRGSLLQYIESVLQELLLGKAHVNTWLV
jgi:DNA mismatch repair ATPase MutL